MTQELLTKPINYYQWLNNEPHIKQFNNGYMLNLEYHIKYECNKEQALAFISNYAMSQLKIIAKYFKIGIYVPKKGTKSPSKHKRKEVLIKDIAEKIKNTGNI